MPYIRRSKSAKSLQREQRKGFKKLFISDKTLEPNTILNGFISSFRSAIF